MDQPSTEDLLQALQDSDEQNRTVATAVLWDRWFTQKGNQGNLLLQQSQWLIDADRQDEAETLLSNLVAEQPDFAEAWNRRAVLYFLQSRFTDAIADCQRVIELVPYHFGALHGLGLCHASLGEYSEAIQAFRRALEVQPYALINQRLILECTARL